jgi:hypothetical protein
VEQVYPGGEQPAAAVTQVPSLRSGVFMTFESAFAVYVSVVIYALFEPKTLTGKKQKKNP